MAIGLTVAVTSTILGVTGHYLFKKGLTGEGLTGGEATVDTVLSAIPGIGRAIGIVRAIKTAKIVEEGVNIGKYGRLGKIADGALTILDSGAYLGSISYNLDVLTNLSINGQMPGMSEGLFALASGYVPASISYISQIKKLRLATQIVLWATTNEGVAQVSSYIATGEGIGFNSWGDVGIHALLVGSGALTAVSGRLASSTRLLKLAEAARNASVPVIRYTTFSPRFWSGFLSKSSAYDLVRKMYFQGAKLAVGYGAGIGQYAGSQAGLWGETYLLTGMLSDAVFAGQAPTSESIKGHYLHGAGLGAMIGGVAGLSAVVKDWSFVKGKITPLNTRFVSRVSKISGGYVSRSFVLGAERYALAGVTGAAAFPLMKTWLENETATEPFLTRLGRNYSDPWNYLRGGIIGLGVRYGFNGSGPLGGILGRELAKGQSAWGLRAWSLRGQKFLLGFGVGAAAEGGVNLLKDAVHRDLKSWNVYVIDATEGGLLGGLTALYASRQSTNILKGLKELSGKGETQVTVFNRINLGKASAGPEFFYKNAASGAIEWLLVSPAFTIGGAGWESIKVRAGR
ncbi:MAG: hypothetical protein NT033_07630 [Candidatus Omnitrophica bacterium]|nr:hypothetical protein [Candidatus Omnitrophota bacterium]